MKLIAGNSNPALAAAIAAQLKLPLTKVEIRRFADNEIFVEIEENVRGQDVFGKIVQEMNEWCDANGVKKLSDLIGKVHANH